MQKEIEDQGDRRRRLHSRKIRKESNLQKWEAAERLEDLIDQDVILDEMTVRQAIDKLVKDLR